MLPNRNPGIPLWMGKLKIKCKHSDYWCVFNDVKVTLEIGGTVVVFTATKCPCQTVGTANDSSWGTSQGCVDGRNGFENEVLFTRMLEAIRVKWKHWFNSPAVVSTKYQHITSRFHFAFGFAKSSCCSGFDWCIWSSWSNWTFGRSDGSLLETDLAQPVVAFWTALDKVQRNLGQTKPSIATLSISIRTLEWNQ